MEEDPPGNAMEEDEHDRPPSTGGRLPRAAKTKALEKLRSTGGGTSKAASSRDERTASLLGTNLRVAAAALNPIDPKPNHAVPTDEAAGRQQDIEAEHAARVCILEQELQDVRRQAAELKAQCAATRASAAQGDTEERHTIEALITLLNDKRHKINDLAQQVVLLKQPKIITRTPEETAARNARILAAVTDWEV